MDRQINYVGAIPQDIDLLQQNKNTMVGLGYALQAILGTSTVVDGLACTQNGSPALNVLVAPGSIYSLQNVDGTAYGSIAPDTVNQIVKQGIILTTTTLSTPAPGTAGQSINYLVQVAYQDTDSGSTVLPYYNASNPAVAYSGPNNTGVSQNTVRKSVCLVSVKAGTAATTGTQTTPAPDAGYTGLYAVTVANGQATVLNGNILKLATAPFIGTKLTAIQAAIQAGTPSYAADTSGAANTIAIALSPIPSALTDGMRVRVKVANNSTGAVVINTNTLGNVSVKTPAGAAMASGTFVANGLYDFTYDANGTRWIYDGSGNSASATTGFSTGDVKMTLKTVADSGWVIMNDGTIGDGSSGASTRANADTSALFALLWNNCVDADAPVVGGRGGSAAADFAAHKKITLPLILGRALAGAGSGSGLTARALGHAVGEETHTLTAAESASLTYTSTVSDPTHTHVASAFKEIAGTSGGSTDKYNSDGNNAGGAVSNPTTGAAATGITVATTDNAGSGAHNNIQPTTFLNVMIKL